MEEGNGLKEHVTPTFKISEEGQVDDNAGVRLKAPEEQIVQHEGKEKEIPRSDPFDVDAEQCNRDDEQVKVDILVEELIKDEEVIEADMTDMAEESLKEVKDNEVKVDDSSCEEGMNLDMPNNTLEVMEDDNKPDKRDKGNNPKQMEEGQKPENKEEANKPKNTEEEGILKNLKCQITVLKYTTNLNSIKLEVKIF